ncbi:MAG: GPR endopeptidase [Lachnospiraceae bacterium]|nr:GPR endopeptidase [Lachnospiraceae bacterium]
MERFQIRTDLALEARESVGEGAESIHGVRMEEYTIPTSEIHVTKVMIESKNGARMIGKPMGTYITLEAPNLLEPDEDYHAEVSREIAKHVKSLIPGIRHEKSILVVGLGNRDVTADALGPRSVDNLLITRHVMEQFGPAAYDKDKMHKISAIVPGVMARTGMEACEIVRGIVEQTKPDVIVAIDALAARSTKRLNRTIQITNTGIHPGSGVGNHRNALTEESLSIPVIAIGIPTVVDAASIVNDVLEKNQLPLFTGELANFYVTGKDIDEIIKKLSFTISEALNQAFDM